MSTTDVSAKDVMALRQKTGLGMMDCKKALQENNGDMAAAESWLREKRKGKMDTRTERTTGEGRIGIAIDGPKAVIIELRTETDFTAKNDAFLTATDSVAGLALGQAAGDVEADYAINKHVDDLRITTGENISFARGVAFKGGTYGRYVHHDGKLGVLVQFEGSVPEDLATGICQHVAAHVPTPLAVDEHGLPGEVVEAKRAEATKEAMDLGKPEEIATKIAEGKMRKFLEDNTLLGQKYVRSEDGKTVSEMLPEGARILHFVRMRVGSDAAED